MSAGHECVGGARGPSIVSSAADVLGMRSWVECVKCVFVCLGAV